MTRRLLQVVVIYALAAAMTGCGNEISPGEIRSSESAYDNGNKAFAAGDFQRAKDEYTAAIDGGGLYVDLYVEARVKRAVALAALGECGAAHEDLDAVLEGAADLASVYAARSFVFEKEGDTANAKQAFQQARRINPQVEKFEF